MRDPEYDRFGPWILEITETDPLPPLFVPYVEDGEACLLRVKIPRQEERRNLRPGMDMYDYVVSMYEEEMDIHVRDGKSVAKFTIAYEDIVAFRNTEDLLNGHLRIYSREFDYDIPYSTVSEDLVQRIIGIMRERFLSGESRAVPVPEGRSSDGMGFYFTGYLNNLAVESPEFSVLAAQPETRAAAVEKGFWKRLFYGAIDKRLLESMHLTDGRELRIVGRGRTWAYRWNAVYGKETLYLPIGRIVSYEMSEDSTNVGAVNLILETGISKHRFVLRQENPDIMRYFEWLGEIARN